MSTWNAAARAAVLNIFAFFNSTGVHSGSALSDVRQELDVFLEFYFHEAAPAQREIDFWKKLGSLSLAAGLNNRVFLGYEPETPAFWELAEQISTTLVKKQQDYGSDNIARFGTTGLQVRFHDKVARLENLAARGANPQNESVFDNYQDLIGYAAIGMMWSSKTFLLPLDR